MRQRDWETERLRDWERERESKSQTFDALMRLSANWLKAGWKAKNLTNLNQAKRTKKARHDSKVQSLFAESSKSGKWNNCDTNNYPFLGTYNYTFAFFVRFYGSNFAHHMHVASNPLESFLYEIFNPHLFPSVLSRMRPSVSSVFKRFPKVHNLPTGNWKKLKN